MSSAIEGTVVSMYVTGTNCQGETIDLEVYEEDVVGDALTNAQPGSVTFSGSSVNSQWMVEWECDGNVLGVCILGDPEYYFRATLQSNSNENVKSNLLSTQQANLVE